MRKAILTQQLAKETKVSKAEAADRLENIVHQIVSNLRKGQNASLPGLGHFRAGKPWTFDFEKDGNAGK